jgi:hypothetical protein
VSHDVRAGRGGLGDPGGDLLGRVLRRRDAIVGRVDAAADHHLDLAGAAPQFLPDGALHLGHPVGDGPHHGVIVARAGRAAAAAHPQVPVAAGLGDRPAGREQARPLEVSLVDGTGQARVGAGGIPHGGEAAVEHAAENLLRAGRDVVGRDAVRRVPVGRVVDDVYVGIDEARHDHLAAQVERLLARRLVQPRADLGDAVTRQAYVQVRAELAALGVKDGRVRQQHRRLPGPVRPRSP